MRLLADENVPGPLVRELAKAGCDIAWIRTLAPGASDHAVLALAIEQSRILLTFDKDFGEIARTASLPDDSGVILMRVPMPPPSAMSRLAEAIASRSDWAGRFSVVEPGRVRTRPMRRRQDYL